MYIETGSPVNGEFTVRQQQILIGSKITARHAWEIMSIGWIITGQGNLSIFTVSFFLSFFLFEIPNNLNKIL